MLASDNGTPKQSARTTVIIRLKDYNNSPTLFKKSAYESSVSEDARPGTVVLTLDVTDADVDLQTPVDFYIIGEISDHNFRSEKLGNCMLPNHWIGKLYLVTI